MIGLFRRIRDSRVLHYLVAVSSIGAGLFYLIFPPVTTIGFFSGAWPPYVWGGALVLGGVIKLYGLHSRILDWQLLGLTFLLAGWVGLAFAQTLVMFGPPITPTRGGGVIGLWVLVLHVFSRFVMVACDREDGQQAQEQIDEGR